MSKIRVSIPAYSAFEIHGLDYSKLAVSSQELIVAFINQDVTVPVDAQERFKKELRACVVKQEYAVATVANFLGAVRRGGMDNWNLTR